jgi:hypothetical protein
MSSAPMTDGDRVAAALKAASEAAMRNSNMGQIEAYRINHVIRLIERERARVDQQWRMAIRKEGYPELTVDAIQRHVPGLGIPPAERGDG